MVEVNSQNFDTSSPASGGTLWYGNWTWPAHIIVAWDSITKDTPCGAVGFLVQIWDDQGSSVNVWTYGQTDLGPNALSFDWLPHTSYFRVSFYAPGMCSTGVAWNVSVSGGSYNPCPCGGESKPGTGIVTTITVSIIDIAAFLLFPAAAPEVLAQWLLGFDALATAANVYPCDPGPPPTPVFDSSDYILGTQVWAPSSFPKHAQLLGQAIWHTACQCKSPCNGVVVPQPPAPRGPALPLPYDRPRITVDDHSISITIDNSTRSIQQIQYSCQQVSNVVNQITNEITQIGDSVTNITNNLTVISGLLGLAYDLGTLHAGLVGQGQFGVPTIAPVGGSGHLVGLLVEIVDDIHGRHDLVGNPPYLWDRGWLSIDNADGMLDEKRLTRSRQVWLPKGATSATSFQWWLPAGLVIDVTELVSP